MSEPVEYSNHNYSAAKKGSGRLAATIREIKNDIADRDDVVVDIREAQLTRLELLADELKPVFAEVPHDDDWFDLVISSGVQPRLWIDAVAHVTMARDRRTYRFLRDSRLGRVVMAESSDAKKVAEQVTRYIAERIVERRRALAGDTLSLERAPAPDIAVPIHGGNDRSGHSLAGRSGKAGSIRSLLLRGLVAVIIGGLVGAGAVLVFSGTLMHYLDAVF